MPAPALFSPTMSQLEQLRDTLWTRVAAYDWVTGVDLGRAPMGGGDQQVLRLHLCSEVEVSPAQCAALPDVIAGVAVHLVHASYHSPMDCARPSVPAPMVGARRAAGQSIGRLSGATGTTGVLVLDRQTRQPGVLSSWQVLAGGTARRGDPIVHPGLADADIAGSDHVASLTRWLRDWDGDAAFARLEAGQRWLGELGVAPSAGVPPLMHLRRTGKARVGARVQRFGRGDAVAALVDGVGIYRRRYQDACGHVQVVDMQGILLRDAVRGRGGACLSGRGHQGALWTLDAHESAQTGGPDEAAGLGLQCASSTTGDSVILSDLGTVLQRLDLILPDANPKERAPQRVPDRWRSVGDFFEYCQSLEGRSKSDVQAGGC